MITKEKFLAYLAVQESGETNMFDVANVIMLASDQCETDLTRADCLDIMKNYAAYKAQYVK